MAKSVLNVEPRVRIGKGGARKVRRDGLVPAVVYGKGMEALNLRVDPKALQQAIATEAGWNTLITLKGDGPFDGKVVILKDLQIDAIEQWPTQATAVTLEELRSTGTIVSGIAEEPAGAGIHCCNQHKTRRIGQTERGTTN